MSTPSCRNYKHSGKQSAAILLKTWILLSALATVACAAAGLPLDQHTCEAWLKLMPETMILHAPYTPFKADDARSLNATAATIDLLAAQAKSFGVNTVWVPGSMGQFDVISVSERKVLLQHWISAGKKHGIYVIAHVGTPIQSDAIEMAEYAVSLDADAIASVPGYYEDYTDVESVARFIAPIAAAAPQTPFFYYHIPEVTGATIQAFELMNTARNKSSLSTYVPTLCGIKFVSSNLADWFNLVRTFNESASLMFAPEPKMASFPFTGRGVVLAEDFYAPTFIRMYQGWLNGDDQVAYEEQAWKYSAEKVFGTYGGTSAKRLLYEKFPITGAGGVNMGPGRLPKKCFNPAEHTALFEALQDVDFWQKIKLER